MAGSGGSQRRLVGTLPGVPVCSAPCQGLWRSQSPEVFFQGPYAVACAAPGCFWSWAA